MTSPAELLGDCRALGIRLRPSAGGGLTIDGPQEALTPDLVSRLRARKSELLALLRPVPTCKPI